MNACSQGGCTWSATGCLTSHPQLLPKEADNVFIVLLLATCCACKAVRPAQAALVAVLLDPAVLQSDQTPPPDQVHEVQPFKFGSTTFDRDIKAWDSKDSARQCMQMRTSYSIPPAAAGTSRGVEDPRRACLQQQHHLENVACLLAGRGSQTCI